jgi:hypothetical protein
VVNRSYLILILLPGLMFAYELGMLNVEVPSPLEKLTLEFDLEHRFYGSITDTLSNFLGVYDGANSFLGLKFTPVKGLEVGVSRKSTQREWSAGASYSHRFPRAFIRGRVGIDYFNYQETGVEPRPQNLFYQLTLQSEPILKRIKPTFAVAYDGYNQRVGLATGISVILFTNVWYFEEIGLLGEYYPVVGRSPDASWLGSNDAFVFGIGFSTAGHHFLLSLGNTWDVGSRRLMLGTNSGGLHIGLGIKRRFEF